MSKQIYFEQFGLALYSYNVKQFSISTDFVYTQLNVKTVLYIKIQSSVSTV